MVLLGIPERNYSISYPGHTNFQQTIGNTKKAKNKDIQGVQWCRICNKKKYHARNDIKCARCKHIIHKACSKIQNAHNFVCATCLTESFPFIQIENFDLEKLSFNTNFTCSCLQKGSYSNIHENYLNNIFNLKELTFNKNPDHSAKDTNVNVTDPTCFKYYLNHKFHKLNNNINSGKNDKFSLLHTNRCSLQDNFEKLQMLLSDLEYQFDVIALTETWHNDKNPSFVVDILPGYQKYESTGSSTKNGGCGLYIKNSIPYILRTHLNIRHKGQGSEFETYWIEMTHPAKSIVLDVVYQHPKQKDKHFPKYLKETLNKVARENKKVILAGDFNLNLLKFDTNTEVNDYLDLLTRKWFTPHILGPTRTTSHDKPSLIDHIFLNFNDIQSCSGNLIGKITDYLPNFLIIEKRTVKLDNQDRPLKRDLKNFDEDKLVRDIAELNLKQKIENIRGQIPYILRTHLNIRHKGQGSEFETYWIEMTHPAKSIVLDVVYQHPKQKDKHFPKYLKETLNKVARENKKVILAGDFNLNLLKFDTNTEVNDYLDLLTRKWFTPHILGPTRTTSHDKPSLIDHIFLNFNDIQSYSGNLIGKITDYLPNFLIIEKRTVKLDNQDRPLRRDLKNFDEDKLVRDIAKVVDKNTPLKKTD